MDLDGYKTNLRLGSFEFLSPVIITGETDASAGKKSPEALAALFLLSLENFKFFFCHGTKIIGFVIPQNYKPYILYSRCSSVNAYKINLLDPYDFLLKKMRPGIPPNLIFILVC